DRRAEENRRLPAGQEFGDLEGMACRAHELDVMAKCANLGREKCVEPRIAEPFDQLAVVAYALLARSEAPQALAHEIENSTEALSHPERPADRSTIDLEHRFDLLQQCHGLAHFAVEFVDERYDGCRTQPAHLEQLDRLCLDALGCIDHHHCRID